MKIGVFDSGVGGQSVVNAIQKALPKLEVVYATDRDNLPYGTKNPRQLKKLVISILNKLTDEGCKIIVIACNTVTTTIIEDLRREIEVPLIGMEPMVKPAALRTISGVIAVCATPATLASKRYAWLKQEYAKGITVIEPDCSDWAFMIESKQIDQAKIRERIEAAISEGADVIVLGCTHYHWIEELIKQIAGGRARVLQPEQPVINQLTKVLARPA
jgi:glutamate racemase